MEYKFIKKHCNAVELYVALLDKELQTNFMQSLQYCTFSRPGHICKEIETITHNCKAGYITLTLARDIYRMLGYEIEVSAVVDVKQDECYLIGKYRWSLAFYDKITSRKQHLAYSNNTFDSYNEALENALCYAINYEMKHFDFNSEKQNNNMKNSQKASTGNQVDDFVNDVKDAMHEVKQDFNAGVDSVRSFIDDFNKSEAKKEMIETAQEAKETAKNAAKKTIKFGKAVVNAGKAFFNSFND